LKYYKTTILVRLFTITFLAALLFTGCAQNKPVTPDGSKPNEYSAYLFSAANVLYFDNQLDKAEEIYRLALKFDPHSSEIRKALFNTLLNRVSYNEVPLLQFSGYVDSLLAMKEMDKLMLEQTYDIYIHNKENLKAELVLKTYLKKYQTARAYTSLFYLEQTLYDKNRLELLDKAFNLGKGDSDLLNSLGLLYLAFDAGKAEQIWLVSAESDTTAQAAALLWGLYSKQKKPDKLLSLYRDYSTPENQRKLNDIISGALESNDFASILAVREPILASGDPFLILKLLQASWPAGDMDVFEQARSMLNEDELSNQDKQLLHLYFVLYALKMDDKPDALNWMAKLDGRAVLDELLMIYRSAVVSEKTDTDSLAVIRVKENLRNTVEPALENQLASPVKIYLLAAIDSLSLDNRIQVSDSIAFGCVKWFYDNNRKTYDTYLFMVQYYNKAKQDSLQKTILLEALEEYPQDASLLNWLGYTYVLNNEKLDEAEALIRRALQLSPDNPYYLDSLAWLFYTKGDYETALNLMEIPSRLEEMPSEVALHLAKIYLALDDRKAAADYLNLTIKIGDDPGYTSQAQQLLEELNSR
jgi:tetratricopeptide (TPR) repeat protein